MKLWQKALMTILYTIYMVLASCAAKPDVAATGAPRWTLAPLEMTGSGLSVIGIGYPAANEREARESALEGAMTEFLRYTGVEVSSYLKMVATETSSGNKPGQVRLNNRETITQATEGFVKKVRQLRWHLLRDDQDRFVAYAQVLVPAAEVARVEAERQALLEAKRAPYRKARRAFDAAITEHRLTTAARMIPDLLSLAQLAEIKTETNATLAAEIFEGLEIAPCDQAGYDLAYKTPANLSLCATHRDGPVPNLPLTVVLPSGLEIAAATGDDGKAEIPLPSPSQAGTYALLASTVIEGLPAFEQTFPFTVLGQGDRLSDGRFHNYLEAKGTASASDKETGHRQQTERAAMVIARQLAFAKLLEMRDGLYLATEIRTAGQALVSERTTATAQGYVTPYPVEEVLDRKGPDLTATVVYRMPLR